MKKKISNSKLIAYSAAAGAALAITPNAFAGIVHGNENLSFGGTHGTQTLEMDGNAEFSFEGDTTKLYVKRTGTDSGKVRTDSVNTGGLIEGIPLTSYVGSDDQTALVPNA